MQVKLSIITINLNDVNGLRKTIESVIHQNYLDYEFIIIDGDSNDGSKSVIEDNAHKLSYWISEPDKGIYNAMNKGIKQAKGEYCLFLNSGDYFMDSDVLNKVFSFNFSEDIVFGDLMVENGRKVIYPDHPSIFYVFKYSLPHQATLFKRELFDEYGLYNEEYKIISDWEYYMKTFFKFKCSYRHIDVMMVVYTLGGMSGHNYENNFIEKRKSMKVNFPDLCDLLFDHMQMESELNNFKNSRLIKAVNKVKKWFK